MLVRILPLQTHIKSPNYQPLVVQFPTLATVLEFQHHHPLMLPYFLRHSRPLPGFRSPRLKTQLCFSAPLLGDSEGLK